MKALWLCVLGVAGCVADVGTDSGESGATDVEDIGEAIDPVKLAQCHKACEAGADYFRKLFCPKLGTARGLLCAFAAAASRDICEGRCRDGMGRDECAKECCDRAADSLDHYCDNASAVPTPLFHECQRVALEAGGKCNNVCK